MTKQLKRNGVLLAVIAMIAVLCVSMICLSVSEDNALAAGKFVKEDTITIGHITDTHYYPLRLGYTNGPAIETDSLDYFYNYVMDKSTKLWLEAEAAFDGNVKTLAEEMPDYVVLSGDTAQDGELIGHIDVANKLRALQNTVRAAGKPNFQIFVVMGNHDMYNPDTFRFDNDGYIEPYYYTTRIEVAQIYAGLGYPNITDEEAAAFYAPLVAEGLMDGKYAFVNSTLATNLTYTWEFLEKDGENTRTYAFEGADALLPDDVTLKKMIDRGEVKLIDNGSNFRSAGSMAYSYTNGLYTAGDDIAVGELTGIAARHDGKFSFISADVILSDAIDGHVLGAQLQQHTMDWLEENKSLARPDENTTIGGTLHHSVVPHWSMEEEITTGFIVYNPVEIADFFADYGVRYMYTGHQHANDKAGYVSMNGNQIIDMEGAASVSIGSQIKITTVDRGTYDGKYAENAYLNGYPNENVDITELYDKVFKNDKYGYVARNKVAEFIDGSKKIITDYSSYARRRVYDNIVDNFIEKLLTRDIVDSLGGMVEGISFSIGPMNIDLGKFSTDVVTLVNNLLDGINEQILTDYTYSGTNPRFKKADMKAFGWVEELVRRVLDLDLSGEGDKVFDVFMDCYARHCTGEDWNSWEEMIAEKPTYGKAFENIKSGKFVDDLLNILLDEENGLMFLVKGLANTTFDLSEGISDSFNNIIGSVTTLFSIKESDAKDAPNMTLKTFNLGQIAKTLGGVELVTDLIDGLGVQIDLVNMTIPEILEDIISKYLTDNFKQGLGEYAYNIITGFGIDGGHKDVIEEDNQLMKIAEYEAEDCTYIAKTREEVITIENGKLPSMLTVNFGKDTTSTMNFTYFTDRRITAGGIQYTTDLENHTGVKNKTAYSQVYGTTKPLIDLGIWCQSGYTEITRHTVSLTGLEPGTTYAYRVGNATKGYWSEWYTFTTASESGAFEALISTDLQSSTQSAYERIALIQKDVIGELFQNGVSFMINPGDIVDNGRNLSQYKWLYDADQSIFASAPSVVAAGNHDDKFFSLDKASNTAYYGGVSEDAYVDEYNYMWTHYNYDTDNVDNTGFYYSFDYGKVHFVVLNTNDIETVESKDENGNKVKTTQLAKDQYEWLLEDLQGSTADYKVVVMHKSLYSEGSHSYDKDVMGMRAQLTPIFAENGVNLVLAGHDHVYNETFYLDKDGNKVNTDANGKNEIGKEGTLYVTMGCAGEKFYNFVDNDTIHTNSGVGLHDKDSHLSDPTFGKLVYDGEKLYYYGYEYVREFDENGNLVGGTAVEIAKGGNDLVGIVTLAAVAVVLVASIVGGIITAVVKKKKA